MTGVPARLRRPSWPMGVKQRVRSATFASCQPLSVTPCWPSYSRCRETRICTEGKENAVRTQTIILSLPGNGYVWLTQHIPGIALATLVGLSAWALQRLEVWLMGQAVLEAMVFALLLGMLWRNLV